MHIDAISIEGYLNQLDDERKQAMNQLRAVILEHLPQGFAEVIQYSMPSYVVPHSLYPAGIEY